MKQLHRCTHCFLRGQPDYVKPPQAFGAYSLQEILPHIIFRGQNDVNDDGDEEGDDGDADGNGDDDDDDDGDDGDDDDDDDGSQKKYDDDNLE